MKFHHIGIPTDQPKAGEVHLADACLFVTPVDASEHRIEWLRFEANSPLPDVLKTTAHVAYEVDDLDAALKDREILLEPFVPMEGVRVAFILDHGAPVEYMQISG